ncbi:MAG: acyltransferase [Rhodospirillales bacterium]|nr:acyltransferase [Rhodospirillales bacterium]
MTRSLPKIISRSTTDFPKNIKGLTSLRFFAVLYVILFHYHFKFTPSVDLIISKGYLAVDFFFILSGFILTHCYFEALQNKTFSYRGFLIRRIARIYPVHLFTLALMLLCFGVYFLGHFPLLENKPTLSDLIQNIFLVHSWGLASDLSYNRYSWTISAELFAYLLFPVLLLTLNKIKPVGIALALSVVLYCALWMAVPSFWSLPLSKMSVFGLPRIFPEFIMGIALYLFSLRYELNWHGQTFLTVCLVAMGLGLLMHWGDWIAIPAFALIILATAEQSRAGKQGFLYRDSSEYLGEISYSLYMIQYPYFFIFDLALKQVLGLEETSRIWGYGWSISPMILILLAMACHKYIETPARVWTIKRLSDPAGTK